MNKRLKSVRAFLTASFYLLFTLLFSSFSHSTDFETTFYPLTIDRPQKQFKVDEALYVFRDGSDQLSINDIVTMQISKWRHANRSVPSYGFSKSPYWFSVSINNEMTEDSSFFLHLDYAALDHIEVYKFNEGLARFSYIAGDLYPFEERPINYPSFLFPFDLPAGESIRLVFKVKNDGPMVVPTRIWLNENFLDFKQRALLIYGAFIGILLIMSLYNMGLYISLRERNYLYYALFTLSYLGLKISLEGIAYQFLWSDYPTLQQRSVIVFGALTSLFLLLFTRHFLPIAHTSRINPALKYLTAIGGLGLVASLILPYTISAILQALFSLAVIGTAITISLVLSKRSLFLARLFLSAWFLFFAGMVTSILNSFGLMPYTDFNEYGSMVGATLGLLLLSIALGNRINIERSEKAAARKEALSYLKRFKGLYDNSLEGIFILNQHYKFVEANPRITQLTRIDNRTLMGTSLLELMPSRLRSNELVAALDNAQEIRNFEVRIKSDNHGDGNQDCWVAISLKRVKANENLSMLDAKDEVLFEGSMIDINERKVFEQRLGNLALQDSLTGLSKRRSFEIQIKEQLAKQTEDQIACILCINIDQFKVLNELYGHAAGDSILKSFAKRLEDSLNEQQPNFLAARESGDEFLCMLRFHNEHDVHQFTKNLLEQINSESFFLEGEEIHLEASIGTLIVHGIPDDATKLISKAKRVCQKAKELGRNRIHIAIENDEKLAESDDQTKWVGVIRKALQEDQFALQLQEIRDINIDAEINTKIPSHFEVLLRLQLEESTPISPAVFIPSAEKYGLMPLLDRWVIEHFLKWNEVLGEESRFDCASLNLSMQSIADIAFHDWLEEKLKSYSLAPERICLEFTESVAMSDLAQTTEFIRRFKAIGCRFALDDFGTGHSSYAYLKELGVDYVKIDGVFIHNIVNNPVDFTLVKSISEVASAMGLETIAEFVEDKGTVEALKAIGINHIQGYFIHKPTSINELC